LHYAWKSDGIIRQKGRVARGGVRGLKGNQENDVHLSGKEGELAPALRRATAMLNKNEYLLVA
jgi:hypothetical protein